ncbi:hypothetical protein KIW84_061797 [Lathyrus oleraceus]|uniref:Uncharacterized protein n=1 Tax=Pisum sativum TaxID=3888 RepID=A0A9D4W6T8_PEA|nr:hypothetical protein KIW84_061797 [Pisum sativum]
MRRRPSGAYKCTKCDKFGHNVLSCKRLTQDPNALEIKRKPKTSHKNINVQTTVDVQSSVLANVRENIDVHANVDVRANVQSNVQGNVQHHVDASQVVNNVVAENNVVHIDASQAESCVVK